MGNDESRRGLGRKGFGIFQKKVLRKRNTGKVLKTGARHQGNWSARKTRAGKRVKIINEKGGNWGQDLKEGGKKIAKNTSPCKGTCSTAWVQLGKNGQPGGGKVGGGNDDDAHRWGLAQEGRKTGEPAHKEKASAVLFGWKSQARGAGKIKCERHRGRGGGQSPKVYMGGRTRVIKLTEGELRNKARNATAPSYLEKGPRCQPENRGEVRGDCS